MKTRFFFLGFLCSLVICITAVSCSKDDEPGNDKPDIVDPSKPTDDPPNTVTVNLLKGATSSSSTNLSSGVKVYIDAAYNICGDDGTEVVDIGAVAGLGNIVSIPNSGWKNKAAAIVGHGYVFKYQNYYSESPVYARLYIDGALMSDSVSVMGYTVKYQCPMELPIKLSDTSITLSSEGEPLSEIEIVSGTNIQVKEAPSWTVVKIENNTLNISGSQNMTPLERTGTIVLSNYSGDVEITVTQQGGEDIFAGGSGTEEDPYQIATAKQLDNVRYSLNSYFIQTADIDLSDFIDPDGNGWDPISGFKGEYDGNFKTISEFWIDRPTTRNIALFGSETEATLKRIILKINGRTISGNHSVAGICGSSSDNNIITQCSVEGWISGKYDVCGIAVNGKLSECRMLGNIFGYSSSTWNYYDGLSIYGEVTNSYIIGDINVDNLRNYTAAFTRNKAINCYIIGTVTGNDPVYAGQATHCYGLNESEETMKKKATFEGWNFNTVWDIKEGVSYPTLRCFK